MLDIQAVLEALPHLPGVYRMLDAEGQLLYVGKAVDLKKRVSSYFQKSGLSPRIQLMVKQIAQIETTVVRNEAEALLLENNLIKALHPRYNILFRDDKSYPYLMLSGHAYPQLSVHRGRLLPQHRYFGPYPNSSAVREAIQTLQQVFLLRTCEDTVFQHRARPCLLHQVKRCSAPCTDQITPKAYQADVDRACAFLSGQRHAVVDQLTQDMFLASDTLDFETAAVLRDRIQALSRIQEKQYISSHDAALNCDVISVVGEGDMYCVNVVMIRGGQHLGDKSLFPDNAEGCDAEHVLNAFVTQHYANHPPPPLVLSRYAVSPDIGAYLRQASNASLQFSHQPRGQRRVWLEMSEKNGRLALAKKQDAKSTQESRLLALNEVLGGEFRRMECFDISHTMGEATVASCVVFDHGAMQSAEYRRFNISGITPGDDYAAMHQALQRRYAETAQGIGQRPDLLLIDGGQGQVKVACHVLDELGLADIPILGVAKGEARKPGLETLILAREEKTLQLPSHHPALHLIQTVRDEAHRFAITGHRAQRAKARTTSRLESIPGIGPKRRQRLLVRFGGLKGLSAASLDDIAGVEGISQRLAETIYHALHEA